MREAQTPRVRGERRRIVVVLVMFIACALFLVWLREGGILHEPVREAA